MATVPREESGFGCLGEQHLQPSLKKLLPHPHLNAKPERLSIFGGRRYETRRCWLTLLLSSPLILKGCDAIVHSSGGVDIMEISHVGC